MGVDDKPGFDLYELFLGEDEPVSFDPTRIAGSHGRADDWAYGCYGLAGPAAPVLDAGVVDVRVVAPTIAVLLGGTGEVLSFECDAIRRLLLSGYLVPHAKLQTTMTTMKAVGFHEHGPIENYELLTVERPSVGTDEVLVDVKASALNYMDLFAVRELDHYVPSYPFWTGGDVAGVIAETGSNVSEWDGGERVLVNPYLSCRTCPACLRGESLACPNFEMLGEMRHGGHAEYLAIPAHALIPIPDHVSFETAAAVPTAGGTAWRALATRGELKPYEEVLIVGATGGVGSFAVQIATAVFNVETLYATTSSEEKAEFLRDLGADHVINYVEESFSRRVWELTEKTGVDAVYNCVGGPTWVDSLRTLRHGGRLITSGATAGPNPETELRLIFIRQLDCIGSSGATPDELETLCSYVWNGAVEPVIQETFALESYEEAFGKMDDRELFGKVLFVQE